MCQWAKDTYRLWCLCVSRINTATHTARVLRAWYAHYGLWAIWQQQRQRRRRRRWSQLSWRYWMSINATHNKWPHRDQNVHRFSFFIFLIWYKNSEWDRSYLVGSTRACVWTRSRRIVRVKWIWRRVVSDRWCKCAEWYKTIQWNCTIIFISAYSVLTYCLY